MSDKNKTDKHQSSKSQSDQNKAAETLPMAGHATRASKAGDAPGAALRVPQEETRLSEKRQQSLPRPTKLEGSSGLIPLKSRGLLASGGFLALFGLKNWRSFVGLGLAGVGAGLLYRGLKDNRIFDADFKRRALNTGLGEARQLNASVVVERPIDEVYEA